METIPKRRIIFLMNRWLSTAGGIQTVNRKLACALAALDDTCECIAAVMTATDGEVENAARNGVTLLRGNSEDDWTSVLLSKGIRGLDPSSVMAIIGHSHFSGQQALHLRDNLFPNATAVQFIHMSPMHTEAHKEYRRDTFVAEREQRLALELELAKRADIVACVGPRLYRYMNQQLVAAQAKPRVVRIDCGFERMEGDRSIPEQPTVLCMGRADSISVKGLDLFAVAAGELTSQWIKHPSTNRRPIPEFIVRGAKDEAEALQDRLVKLSTREDGVVAKILVRPYTPETDELKKDLRAASIFVMPSREEGFGLVACEALSLGVPVVITSESGLAEAVMEMAARTGQDVSGSIVHHTMGEPETVKQYADQMLKVLVDERAAEQRAHQMFEQLLVTNSWEQGAKVLRNELVMNLTTTTSGGVPIRQAVELAAAEKPTLQSEPSEGSDLASRTRTYDIADTLKRHDALLKSQGIVTFVVRHALVVYVEDGATVSIPDKLDDVDVVVRKFDRLKFSSLPIPQSGDVVIYGGGKGTARVGMWVTDQEENLFLTSVAHAIPLNASVHVRLDETGELMPATVAYRNDDADIALLAVPSASILRSHVTLAEASLDLPVRFVLPGRNVSGIVSGVTATVRVEGVGGQQSVTDLFEVRVVGGTLHEGDSGCIITDVNGSPIGFLVSTVVESEGVEIRRVFAKALASTFAALHVRPVAVADKAIASTVATRRVGILADSKSTLDIILQSLDEISRVQHGSTSYFMGRIRENGPAVVVHGLESMGNLSAAVATTNLLREYDINGLILVGIAGGVASSGIAVGDVVVSSEIIHYEPAKVTEYGIDPRFRVVGLTPAWLNSLARDIDENLFTKGVGTETSPLSIAPRIHIGAIASGDKVLQSSKEFIKLLGNWRGVLAVEMEGAGVATAVSMSKTGTTIVSVRGITDLMDVRKDDSMHNTAARRAVAVGLSIARSMTSGAE